MPRKSEKVAIRNPSLDRRVKLTEDQKQEIRIEYAKGDTSHRKLAEKYGVSKRLIQLILDPNKNERMKQQFKERRKDGRYYDKDKHREAVRKHREYKDKLFKEGKIAPEGKSNE